MSKISSVDKNKLKLFSPLLQVWFKKNARDLPWRNTRNPYHILVSEIMAQQTQLRNVIPIYKRFLKRFPTPESLAKANIEDIKMITDNLGYKRRGEYLQQIAQLTMTKYNGRIPNKLEELLKLPGIGKYTAGAILSFAFEKKAPIVDVNVERVLIRVFGLESTPGTADHEKILWALTEGILPEEKQGETIWTHNQAIMELGALVCVTGKPKCLLCPLKEICKYYEISPKQMILDSFL